MTDALPLLIAAARESGALAVRDALRELEIVAAGRDFVACEVAAHATLPAHHRLRAALDAIGATDARRLGKWLEKWEGRVVDGLRIDAIGSDRQGILWRVCRVDTRTGSHTGRGACFDSVSQQPSTSTR
jgi:hypothetical protein